ncbi:ornithine cyclodeaminase family protein [Ramlibacter sp.]|uniref:ornithine cyclodeaminase family protein n=1 Tax=Ramlibacter sp. TaxID=1917967 RepID=UPI003D108455
MSTPVLWLTEQDVVSLVTLDDAIAALERAVSAEDAFNVPKALATYGDGGTMHALASAAPALDYAGFKTWLHTKRGATALYELFDSRDGSVRAVIEAGALGQLRTAAMTGLGTRWMAPEGADELGLVGTGLQSMAQVAAINAVRPLRRVRVFSPTPEKRQAFVAKLRERFGAEIVEAQSLDEAVDGAPIVTLVTRARDPFLHGSALARGAHLNAVGAILPANAEFHPDVFERVGAVMVDDVPNAQKASREFIDHYGGERGWSSVRSVGEVVRSGRSARAEGCDLTLFKAMGMGLSDLAVAMMAYERARERGLGREIPAAKRAALTWKGDRSPPKA